MNKTIHLLIWVALSLSLGIIVLSNYWLFFDSNPPITFTNQHNLSVDQEIYHLGDTIFITAAGCRYTDATEKICWRLQDGISYNMGCFEIAGGAKNKCWSEGKGVGYQLPDHALPPGKYHLSIKSEFKINPITTRYVYSDSEDFIIII